MKKDNKNLTIIVGLGKTGLSCVRFLAKCGKNIAVVDSRENPPGLTELTTKYPNVAIYLGGWHEDLLQTAQQLVVSPGIALTTPAIANQIARGIPVIGDIELFAQSVTKPIVAITGSNGKSTVTTLVGAMAKAAGLKTGVGGNLGTPALDLITEPEPDLYVLELSSFQLETTYSLKAAAATILNVTPDHLDRYRNIEEYAAAKLRIFNNCKTAIINCDNCWFLPENFCQQQVCLNFGLGDCRNSSIFVISAKAEIQESAETLDSRLRGNDIVCAGIDDREGKKSQISTSPLAESQNNEFSVVDNYLVFGKKKLISVTEVLIKGQHQIANALAALALGHAIGLPMDKMLATLKSFPGLEHRCQWVAKINGVDWFNDSKGTNVGATEAAIAGLGASIAGKIVLIAGGQGKGADFSCLTKVVKAYVRTLILIGVDAGKIAAELAGATTILFADSMEQAVELAQQRTKTGDSVLLSPACASFDMFKNFEHRGRVFVELVKQCANAK
jgi:UDP-N-acetylmuramoylalanine--D-glutamate ligase